MLLLTGPPASGKTSFCFDLIRESLRSGATDCRLLTPTTTMAEHLRNELAREGFVFSPKIVSTFGKFVAGYVEDMPPVSRPALEVLVREELVRADLPRYRAVRDFPGFRAALVRAVEEFAGAGGRGGHLAITGLEFSRLFEAVEARLRERGEHFRAPRLLQAAERIHSGPALGTVCVTGFFAFTPAELEVLISLDRAGKLTVALADTPASRPAMRALRKFASAEKQLTAPVTCAPRTLFTAPTVDGEANEVARRIMAEHAGGRAFREIGVIVRSQQPFVPALSASLERFGIPFRSYFSAPLRSDATVRFLLALADAALSGWDHERSLTALRMHGSPLESGGDSFEYRVLDRIPARGLAGLREAAPDMTHPWFDSLASLSTWASDVATATLWAQRFVTLASLFWRQPLKDGVPQQQVLLWRRQSAALEHFAAVVQETARALSEAGPISCEAFREALNAALSSAELRLVDRRHDVVHIIDAVEARQWRLKVMFVCGLLEDQFPKHHTEDPILPDSVRRQLQASGLPMRTSGERRAEEQTLFDSALSRGTEHLYLSYPLLNAKGEPNLPSVLLDRAQPYSLEPASLTKPKPLRPRAQEWFPVIAGEASLTRLATLHSRLSPTRVEKFLTCPWSFFAQRTLRLGEPPKRPWDRLNNLVQGTIAHAVFEAVYRDRVDSEAAFDLLFQQKCEEAGVPDGYRTEAIRLELLHGIRQLVADSRLNFQSSKSLFEEPFQCVLPGGLQISGQIDRLEIDEQGKAIIFDYKYKRKNRIDLTAKENEEGRRVQTGLYLIGAKRLGYEPAGMVYSGFKREASFNGWILHGLWPGFGSACSPAHLQQLMATAQETTLQAWGDILDGRIEPKPSELRDCEFCSYTSVCRIEALPEAAVETVNAAE